MAEGFPKSSRAYLAVQTACQAAWNSLGFAV